MVEVTQCVFCGGGLRHAVSCTSFSGDPSYREYECNACKSRERREDTGRVQYFNSGHPLANQTQTCPQCAQAIREQSNGA